MDIRIVGGVACLLMGLLLLVYGLNGVVNTTTVCTGDNETGTCTTQPSGDSGSILTGLGGGSLVIIFGGFLLMWYYDDYRKKGIEG